MLRNAALSGALALLADDDLKEKSNMMAELALTLDLSQSAFFMDNYVKNMNFPFST